MALSQTADYALRAVVWLAKTWSPDGGTPQTAPQLASATGVPASYLPKVLQPLIRCGLIAGQRGLHGGYTLRRDPHDLTVLDIVHCLDPAPNAPELANKPDNKTANESGDDVGPAPHNALAALDRFLNNVLDDAERRFGQTHIAQLLDDAEAA